MVDSLTVRECGKLKINPNAPTYVVGYHFTNKQGFKAVVIAYNGRKNIDIQFEDGAIVKGTTGSYIAKGLPMHPTFGKILVGDQFPCRCGDTVEVIEYVSSVKIKAKWLSDGTEKWTSSDTLRAGINKNPSSQYAPGDLVETNNHGFVTVVEYKSATDIIVKFSNGETKSTSASALSSGTIRPNKYFIGREGHAFKTNSGWTGVIDKWNNSHSVIVLWQDGSKSEENWGGIKSGSIKPLYQPSVCGIGYIGEGRFLPNSYKILPPGKQYVDPRIYAYWQRMISRCYNEKEQAKPSGKAYIGCRVAEIWHNFQNFAEWAYKKEQAWFSEAGMIWELDKDCLFPGNREYSPESCTFLPPDINIVLADSPRPKGLPRGVNYIKPATAGAKEGYIARCHIFGERKYLGYYEDEMTAFYKYKAFKEDHIKILAEKFKDKLEPEAYNALLKCEIKPYD